MFLIFLAFFALAATAEFARMLGFSLRTSLLASLVLGLPYFLNFYFAFIPWHVYFMLYLLISASILFVFGYTRVSFLQGAGLIFGGLYVPVLASTLALVRYLDDGMLYTLAVLLLTWYRFRLLSGKALGKKKHPAISPNKSWAGAVGGDYRRDDCPCFWNTNGWQRNPTSPFGASLLLPCAVGDLAESAFKRHAGVKDSGSMLPGHGSFEYRQLALHRHLAISSLGW